MAQQITFDMKLFLAMERIPAEYAKFFFDLTRKKQLLIAMEVIRISREIYLNKMIPASDFKDFFKDELKMYDEYKRQKSIGLNTIEES